MRVLFVTAAGETYAPLLRGLVQSLWQWPSRPFVSLACFDLGMAAETRQWLGQYATHVVEPGWDLEVSQTLRVQQPHTRALTVRPFLRDYFPGYSIYLWIDADCWVQERYALDWYLAAASQGNLAVTPEVHHAYHHRPRLFQWRAQRLHAYFGREAVEKLGWATYFNAGIFALKADAPHWTRWRAAFEHGLKATDGKLCCDQTALNHLLWTQGLPAYPLPATCNWLCHLAAPNYDVARQRFCEPVFPGNPLGILHLAADAKDMRVKVPDTNGTREMALYFPGSGSEPSCLGHPCPTIALTKNAMGARDAEAELLACCAGATRKTVVMARDQREANVFHAAAIMSRTFPREAASPQQTSDLQH